MADWLSRNLSEHVRELLVCEPRRNRLIAKDGDKDDDIDAEKLAQLYRGGYLKQVHQSETLERSLLKQHVGYYRHCVRVRVRTFFVYVDTPFRFRSKSALWRYCGIGLKRKHSGKGRLRSELEHAGNRRLKDALLGAAKSAVASKDSPYADRYIRWRQQERIHPPTARRNVARSIAATMLALWKSGEGFDAKLVQ